MNFIKFLVLVNIILNSCSSTIVESESVDWKLTSQELSLFAQITSESFNENEFDLNFHLQYDEKFNDSTFIVKIWVNDITPKKGSFLRKIAVIDSSQFFIYASDDKMSLKGKEVMNEIVFTRIDFPFWKILVHRYNGNIKFEKIQIVNRKTDFEIPNLEDVL